MVEQEAAKVQQAESETITIETGISQTQKSDLYRCVACGRQLEDGMELTKCEPCSRGQKHQKLSNNLVPIGKKPLQDYLRAVIRIFSNKGKEAYVVGRGRFIVRAADVALITVKNKLKYCYIDDVKLETVTMNSDKTKHPVNVSSISIRLKAQE